MKLLARVVDELRALELDDIARAARERDRRAAHMRLPPPHKLEELGLSDSGKSAVFWSER